MKTVLWAVIAAALPCLAARGEVRTFVAEGTVNQIIDPLGTLNFTHLGAPFKYQFSFDSGAPDLNDTPTYGVYDGISSVTFIDGMELPSGAPRIEIQHPTDFFSANSDVVKEGFFRASAGLLLADQVFSQALTSTALPDSPYPLDLFPLRSLGAGFFYPDPNSSSPYLLSIWASVDRFYAVPEPASLLLFAGGLLLLGRKWA